MRNIFRRLMGKKPIYRINCWTYPLYPYFNRDGSWSWSQVNWLREYRERMERGEPVSQEYLYQRECAKEASGLF